MLYNKWKLASATLSGLLALFLDLISNEDVFISIIILFSCLILTMAYKEGIRKIFIFPNVITSIRIGLILSIVYYCDTLDQLAVAALFWFSAILDFLDGYSARKLNQITLFGSYLDEESDSVFVLVISLVMIWKLNINYIVVLPVLLRFISVGISYWLSDVVIRYFKFVDSRKIAGWYFGLMPIIFILPSNCKAPFALILTTILSISLIQELASYVNYFIGLHHHRQS